MKAVYFIKPIGWDGPIKIGCSVSPTGRRKSLEAWSPIPLEIVAEIEGGHGIERRFHERFLADHRAHEWFNWTQDLQDTIDAIRAGTFDIETLPIANGSPLERGKKAHHTPESNLQLSYSLRLSYKRRRTGFSFRGEDFTVVREGLTAEADQYLAEPHIYGEPINAPWAHEKQRAWLAQFESEAA